MNRQPADGVDRRLSAVDAARGAAMLLVCLSHFADAYFEPFSYGPVYELLDRVVMIASPTFMLLSGAMLGLLHGGSGPGGRPDFATVRIKLIDRGLFLLTVAHVLIALAHVPFIKPVSAVLRWGFITDPIGVCIVLGPLLIGRLRVGARVALGGAVYVLSWLAVYAWQPTGPVVRLLKDAAVGPSAQSSWAYVFPALPWFGFYFMSSALGSWLAARVRAGRVRTVARWAAGLGLVAIGVAVVLRGLAVVATARGWFSPTALQVEHELTSLHQKIPPGPAYLLGYGGAGLLLASACFAAEQLPQLRGVLSTLQLFGRNSLMVFVLEYYFYFALMYPLRLRYTVAWPLYFAFSLLLMWPLVVLWERLGGSRFLTVGLVQWARKRTP